MKEVLSKLEAISDNALFNEPMSLHTSFRIGGNADAFISVSEIGELKAVISFCKENKIPCMIMGNGTNMLVSDKGIRGVVLQIGKGMSKCRIEGERVYAEAGILMSALANAALKAELSGFEALSGIPGTLGGGIYMNAGAYGGEIKDVVESVTFIAPDGEINTLENEALDFSYRHSIFETGEYVILSCALKLKKGKYDEIASQMKEYNKRRGDKQPLSMPSAGSTFKRPEGYFAGKLIEDCSLKGYMIGGAQISEKHAGFLINKGGATAKDVMDLIDYTKKTVKEKTGVDLEPEIRLIGEK